MSNIGWSLQGVKHRPQTGDVVGAVGLPDDW